MYLRWQAKESTLLSTSVLYLRVPRLTELSMTRVACTIRYSCVMEDDLNMSGVVLVDESDKGEDRAQSR